MKPIVTAMDVINEYNKALKERFENDTRLPDNMQGAPEFDLVRKLRADCFSGGSTAPDAFVNNLLGFNFNVVKGASMEFISAAESQKGVASVRSGRSNIALQFFVNKSHPIGKYAVYNRDFTISLPIGKIIKQRKDIKSQKNDGTVGVVATTILAREIDTKKHHPWLELPVHELYYRLNQNLKEGMQALHDDIVLIDEFMADYTPDENNAFVKALFTLSNHYGRSHIATIPEVMDAFWREKFLNEWNNTFDS